MYFWYLSFAGLLPILTNGLVALPDDRLVVEDQLGYWPRNFVRVSARNIEGSPIAIQTYPLLSKKKTHQSSLDSSSLEIGTPFPTLYWLTCPSISRAVADLERRGFVSQIANTLGFDPEGLDALVECHKNYADERWNSLSQEHKEWLLNSDARSPSVDRMRCMLQNSGIAGTNTTSSILPSIKCLHTHYADFRSTSASRKRVNPVGFLVHQHLLNDFPGLVL